MDFSKPAPGFAAAWTNKLELIIDSYFSCKLFNTFDINIKIGIDGTNLWKAQLETVTLSFAHIDSNLYKLQEAVHLLGLYVGKEKFSTLKHLFKLYNFNDIPMDYQLQIGDNIFTIHF